MPTYLIINRAPADFTPSPDAFAVWTAWFDGLGAHLVDRGNPAFARTQVGNCAGTVLGGYTLIEAENLEMAADLAAEHPLVSRGGGVEVGELTVINAGQRLAASD